MMKVLVSVVALVALVSVCCAALEQTSPSGPAPVATTTTSATSQINNNNGKHTQPLGTERQGRSIASSGSTGNSLVSGVGGGSGTSTSTSSNNNNVIELSSSKSRLEAEKRQVQEFLTTKNIFKSIVKLLFGNQDEIAATSRHVLGVLSKVLDLLKNTFGQKSRSGTARTIRDSAEDAANAGVSMLQGYVKSVLANDGACAKKYLCQASREAARDGRELGYVIASVGGYATSYLLDNSKSNNFHGFYDASMRGRSLKEDCAKLFADCTE